uniref:Hydroxypyruvate isomerase n=2 Tax=Parascaris univalens TaxID=6257 RepID=A0A914ZI15_PARUN
SLCFLLFYYNDTYRQRSAGIYRKKKWRMRIAANLSIMFQRVDLLQRYEKAASMGFRCVEVSIPYSQPAEKL